MSLPTKQAQGFTLVEFIVIMAIFAVMVGVVLFNFTGFRSRVTLDNLAQDIALSIRQIQSSAGAGVSGTDPTEEIPRGIYFPVVDGKFAKYFYLFEDDNGDGLYTAGDTLIDTINIQTPDSISNIYYGTDINNAENELGVNPLGITFKRYRTDANFADEQALTPSASVVRIEILSVDGTQARFITVSKLGQVSVQSVTLSNGGSTPPIIPNPGGNTSVQ
jgi:Tfp pilus assembly protein FimT